MSDTINSFCSDPAKLRMFRVILDPAWKGKKLPPKLVGPDLLQAFLAHWHSEDNNAFKATITAAISDAPPPTPISGKDDAFGFGQTPASTLTAELPKISVTNPDGSLTRRPFCKLLWKGQHDKSCKCDRLHTDICKLPGCKPIWDPGCLFFHASGKGRGVIIPT
jgi:hypothetical protein